MSMYKSTDFSYPDVKLFPVFSVNIILLQESVLSHILAHDIINSTAFLLAPNTLAKQYFLLV